MHSEMLITDFRGNATTAFLEAQKILEEREALEGVYALPNQEERNTPTPKDMQPEIAAEDIPIQADIDRIRAAIEQQKGIVLSADNIDDFLRDKILSYQANWEVVVETLIEEQLTDKDQIKMTDVADARVTAEMEVLNRLRTITGMEITDIDRMGAAYLLSYVQDPEGVTRRMQELDEQDEVTEEESEAYEFRYDAHEADDILPDCGQQEAETEMPEYDEKSGFDELE